MNDRSSPSEAIAVRSGTSRTREGAPAVETSSVATGLPSRYATARSVPGWYGTSHISRYGLPNVPISFTFDPTGRAISCSPFTFVPSDRPFRNSSTTSAFE